MAYTSYVSQLLLTHLFTTTAVTRPNAWTVALFTGNPEVAGGELTDANYMRQAVTFNVADGDGNDRFEATNVAAVTFPDLAATATVAYVAVVDQTGAPLVLLPLNAPRDLEVGDVFSIPANELIIRGENT